MNWNWLNVPNRTNVGQMDWIYQIEKYKEKEKSIVFISIIHQVSGYELNKIIIITIYKITWIGMDNF